MMEMAFLDHEQMRILVLDTKNRVVENISRYQGTVNSSVLRAAEVYRPAVIRNCPAIIICHNHPSGDPTPSPEDIAVTHQLVAAGQHLDIELVDHLVIGNQRFVSLFKRAVTVVVINRVNATFRNCTQKMYTQKQSMQKRMG